MKLQFQRNSLTFIDIYTAICKFKFLFTALFLRIFQSILDILRKDVELTLKCRFFNNFLIVIVVSWLTVLFKNKL